ncbi:MAG: hypothetical protein AB7I27_12650 [Bacteriovoracaceae bacterium]
MKVLLVLICLVHFSVFAQVSPDDSSQDVEDYLNQTDNPEEADERILNNDQRDDEAELIRPEECQCPEEEVESSQLSFPPGSVFVISPASENQEVRPQKEQAILSPPPEYPLPPGYNNDQFKNIGVP